VQGVCADCWGSKGGRQFLLRKEGPRTSGLEDFLGFDPVRLFLLALVAGAVPALLGLALWIWV
jgi:hypothetical protein